MNALWNVNANSSMLSVTTTINALLMVIIGGVGTLIGPILGAGVLQLLGYWLNATFGPRWPLIFGLVYILIVLFFPYGLVGTWRRWQNRPTGQLGRPLAGMDPARATLVTRPRGFHAPLRAARLPVPLQGGPARRATRARSAGPNQGGAPAAAFSTSRAGEEVAGMATWQRGSLRIHFSNACGQVVTPKGARGASAAGGGGRRSSAPSAKGRITTTPNPRSAARGRIAALDLALPGVVGNLDRADAPGLHHWSRSPNAVGL